MTGVKDPSVAWDVGDMRVDADVTGGGPTPGGGSEIQPMGIMQLNLLYRVISLRDYGKHQSKIIVILFSSYRYISFGYLDDIKELMMCF